MYLEPGLLKETPLILSNLYNRNKVCWKSEVSIGFPLKSISTIISASETDSKIMYSLMIWLLANKKTPNSGNVYFTFGRLSMKLFEILKYYKFLRCVIFRSSILLSSTLSHSRELRLLRAESSFSWLWDKFNLASLLHLVNILGEILLILLFSASKVSSWVKKWAYFREGRQRVDRGEFIFV